MERFPPVQQRLLRTVPLGVALVTGDRRTPLCAGFLSRWAPPGGNSEHEHEVSAAKRPGSRA